MGDVMIRSRIILAYSLSATLLLSTSGIANATCALGGTWHFFSMQGSTPDIKTATTGVRNSADTGTVNVKGFPLAGQAFQNNTANIIKCRLAVSAGGVITNTSPCSSYGVTGGGVHTTTVGGTLTLSPTCDLTGTINVAGDPTPVSIVGGHINGVSGAGIATQGTKQVHHFTLVKN
jgi:hypothetical protein